jgi:hypothetical protein
MSDKLSLSRYRQIKHLIAKGEIGEASVLIEASNIPKAKASPSDYFGGALNSYFSMPFLPSLFKEYVEWNSEALFKELNPNEPYKAWAWSHVLEAAIAGFVRTSDPWYKIVIERGIEHALRFRDSERGYVDAIRGRPLKAWGVTNKVPGTWVNVVTSSGRIVYPILRYLELARTNKWSVPDEWLQASVDALDEFAPDFVTDSCGERGCFERPAIGDLEPLNHVACVGRALLILSNLTGVEKYNLMVKQLAAFFRSALVLEDAGHYAWGYRPTLDNPRAGPATPFWKGDVDLSFIVDCFRADIEFNSADMTRFAATLRQSIIRQDGLYCHVSLNRNVSIEEKAEKIRSNIYGLCSWQMLTPFDANVQILIEKTMIDNSSYFSGGWLGSTRAAVAYAMKQ